MTFYMFMIIHSVWVTGIPLVSNLTLYIWVLVKIMLSMCSQQYNNCNEYNHLPFRFLVLVTWTDLRRPNLWNDSHHYWSCEVKLQTLLPLQSFSLSLECFFLLTNIYMSKINRSIVRSVHNIRKRPGFLFLSISTSMLKVLSLFGSLY